ncbi:hypothetical protein NL676_031260 [Syzygium grande]|nr:hypothetical protein NL676_031260 [Syzygium grande]
MNGVCTDGTEGRIISMADTASMYPGFKFSTSGAELIPYYLTKKLEDLDKSVKQLIPEVDISAHEPWDLPSWSLRSLHPCSNSGVLVACPRGKVIEFYLKIPIPLKNDQNVSCVCIPPFKSAGSLVICCLRRSNMFHMNNASDIMQTSDVDRTDVSEGDNLADGYARKCSGNILKDDIVKLDESSVSATRLPTVPINPEAVLMSQDSQNLVQDFMSLIPPFQGTANQRIRLRRQKPESSSTIALEIKASDYSAEKAELEEAQSPQREEPL